MIAEMHIEAPDEEFLEKVYDEGEVGTHQLVQETSLSKNQVHRRLRKFEEAGVITVEKRNPDGKYWDTENFASLTSEAHGEITRGVLGNIFTADPELVEATEIKEDVEYLRKWAKECELTVKAIRWALEDSDVDLDIDKYKQKIRENSS